MNSISAPGSSQSKDSTAQASGSAPQIQEFSIRVPKNSKKKYNIMRFNAVPKTDFKEWKSVKMERENNMKDFKGMDEDMPKFGAGSEFGREAREEARKKRYGINAKKYKPEDQPWILKINGSNGKKYKGTKTDGINQNAAYYVFTHAPDGAIEAFPLNEWYNFTPIQTYKTLKLEEAEEQYSMRNKNFNYFNLMLRKRLRNEEEGADEELMELEKEKKTNKKKKDLKISEMDEWMSSDDDSSGSEKEDKQSDDEVNKKKSKKGKGTAKGKKKKKVSDDEAFEESDDGDEEGRELDYISDSSASDSELEQQKEIRSVAEESGLKKLLVSDDSDEEDEENKEEENKNDEEDGQDKDEKDKDKVGKNMDKKKDKKKKNGSESPSDNESEFDKDKEHPDKKPTSTQSSRSASPAVFSSNSTDLKRPLSSSPDPIQAKKLKLESGFMSYVSGASESGISEDAVRRYLMRKPMTTTELLQKFKSKKTGLSSDQIVTIMTKILKNINPVKQKIKGKMYFSIKSQQPSPQQ
ncbi:general transcription factor IIF subunit 1 [Trichogramma pretiosum]|uniref:general transcription factor IIF subunit 1 n=1 Tax=Trichogramma pretiosum TaxID=7493 RepID=UPI0006C99437|nr:general transcription factor IIF subunit 1 [Trichogramma pretiosum]